MFLATTMATMEMMTPVDSQAHYESRFCVHPQSAGQKSNKERERSPFVAESNGTCTVLCIFAEPHCKAGAQYIASSIGTDI
mmetsp:Transcript_4213/g.7754  ORF Transcript_4213/g.7754 Transcript_4213/m.7754 type:complete len:81 (+) Transcript_4213:164-406(+)